MAMFCMCDGCGKQAKAEHNGQYWHKPREWFEVVTEDEGTLMSCSRECIHEINKRRATQGKKSLIIAPF